MICLLYISAAGSDLTVLTPDDHKFTHGWVSVKDLTFLTFEIKACNDGHFVLTKNPGDRSKDLFFIILGGWQNKVSAIRTDLEGENVVQVSIKQLK